MERDGWGIIGLPFLGELCGEVGGEESWEEALDTVSSACRLCRSFPSSDRDRIFFRDCGELVPEDVSKGWRWGWGSGRGGGRISKRNAALA